MLSSSIVCSCNALYTFINKWNSVRDNIQLDFSLLHDNKTLLPSKNMASATLLLCFAVPAYFGRLMCPGKLSSLYQDVKTHASGISAKPSPLLVSPELSDSQMDRAITFSLLPFRGQLLSSHQVETTKPSLEQLASDK